ncbi:hypothetical protein [Halovulum sp. GXIMD14793]
MSVSQAFIVLHQMQMGNFANALYLAQLPPAVFRYSDEAMALAFTLGYLNNKD